MFRKSGTSFGDFAYALALFAGVKQARWRICVQLNSVVVSMDPPGVKHPVWAKWRNSSPSSEGGTGKFIRFVRHLTSLAERILPKCEMFRGSFLHPMDGNVWQFGGGGGVRPLV